MNKISLFQNNRNWTTIREQVLDLVGTEHQQGKAQNSQLVHDLEKRLADMFDRKHCITTASCTDALIVALWALNLPQGSRVAVSTYTFTATAHAIARAGHVPVPIDIDNNYCIDVNKINNCDAVVAVDIFGNMSNWDLLNQLKIPVICDAAQSLESHDGKNWSVKNGIASCVSFSPSKPISCWGSGGAILTDSDKIADQAKLLRLHGKNKNSDLAIHSGLNSMISSFEAACVWTGLDHIKIWQQRRHDISKYLIENCRHSSIMDSHLQSHTYSKLVFRSPDRNHVVKKFYNADIDIAVHYQLPVHKEYLYSADCPIADLAVSESFTVPNQHTLTDHEVDQILQGLL